jgi:hypothetical protein
MLQTLSIELNVPDGYVLTGEFRAPNGNEPFIKYNGTPARSTTSCCRIGGYWSVCKQPAWTTGNGTGTL